jgi:hypothetical protein
MSRSFDNVESSIHMGDNLEEIPTHDIIGTYILILDSNNHCILNYVNEWKPLYFTTVKGIINEVNIVTNCVSDYGLHITNDCSIKRIGLQKFEKYYNNKTHIKYINIYTAQTCTNPLDRQPSPFDTPLGVFTFSQLVDLPIYSKLKRMFDYIYDPLKIQLILDIDCTLITTCDYISSNINKKGFVYPQHCLLLNHWYPDCIVHQFDQLRYIWFRPHMYYFLDQVSQMTHLSYWTAASELFQEHVIEKTQLDQFTQQIYYNDMCTSSKTETYKSIQDLNTYSIVGPVYDLDKTILIDDSPINHQHNPLNCTKVKPWNISFIKDATELAYQQSDQELLWILSDVKRITDCHIHQHKTIPQLLQENNFNK